MKKFSIIALVAAAAMLFAIPAMAVDVEWSGHYRVRGFYTANQAMDNTYDSSDSRFDNRIKLEPTFKVSDRLSVHMTIDGLDNQSWGTSPATEDFGVERAWMAIKFDMFDLDIGRMKAGTCGLGYCDSEGDADQIAIGLKGLDPFALSFNYTKVTEGDFNGSAADADADTYSIQASYEMEGILVGGEIAYDIDRTTSTFNRDFWTLNPFVKGTFGPISFNAELQYLTGDYADYAEGQTYTAGGAIPDRDYKAMRYIADVAFDYGPGSVGIGFAHSDGQDVNDNDYTSAALGGNDWQPFLIMTHATANKDLAGLGGNFGGGSATTAATGLSNTSPYGKNAPVWGAWGYNIIYLYGDYAVTEDLTLNAIVGLAEADETSVFGTNVSKDIGTEVNIGAKWKIMDNLTYDIKAGFLAVDDVWKLGSSTSTLDEDVYSIMHTLIVTF